MLILVDKIPTQIDRMQLKKSIILSKIGREKKMNLGERLFELRKTKKLTQDEVAEKLMVIFYFFLNILTNCYNCYIINITVVTKRRIDYGYYY